MKIYDPLPKRNAAVTDLIELIEQSKAKLAAMSPAERDAMWQAQRESWARGEMAMGEAAGAPAATASAIDHRALLAKFVDYILDRNGWAWIDGATPGSKRFTQEEWDELHRMQKESAS